MERDISQVGSFDLGLDFSHGKRKNCTYFTFFYFLLSRLFGFIVYVFFFSVCVCVWVKGGKGECGSVMLI